MKPAIKTFLNDESGGYTIWAMVWFMLYTAIGGLAVDMTDAYRNQTQLQATADAAALAGAVSLPDQTEAVNIAVAYASDNMNPVHNGQVLDGNEVTLGTWDFTTRTFADGTAFPNAVRVVTRRGAPNGNPVEMNFLRIMSLVGLDPNWDISTEAIAVRYVPSCANDGLIAQNRVDLRSNNTQLNNICVHGQDSGVDLQNHNFFELGVQVSMPDFDMLPNRSNLFDMNPGLREALREGDVFPSDVDRLGAIIDGLEALDPNYLPDFMVDIDGSTGTRTVKLGVNVVTGSSLPASLTPDTVYVVNCNGQLNLPKNAMVRVVVVADCRIQSSSGTILIDAVIATSYTGNNAAIKMAAQTVLGLADNCAEGGGVELYTPGDVHISAQGSWNGLRVVAGNDVIFTANNVGINGMSIQAGNDIDYTSNNQFGLCSGGVPGVFAASYRLVR